MEDLGSLCALHGPYDAVYCAGSLINAPMGVTRLEAQELLKHLPGAGEI